MTRKVICDKCGMESIEGSEIMFSVSIGKEWYDLDKDCQNLYNEYKAGLKRVTNKLLREWLDG